MVYAPPEVSGDVFFEVTGTDPNGNQINGPSYMFHVQSSLALLNLNGAGATASNPGITITTTSHPGEGTFGTAAMQTAISSLVAKYYQLGDDAGFTSLDPLTSQAATMIEGGLFDANWNGDVYPGRLTPWVPPHCGHRDGQTIDLSINQLDADEQGWLEIAAKSARFVFTAPGERPGDVSATHWHATLSLTQ